MKNKASQKLKNESYSSPTHRRNANNCFLLSLYVFKTKCGQKRATCGTL